MRIGYPCLNRSIGCTAGHTFRLASYSELRLIATVSANLACLEQMLKYNAERGIGFFRITSDLVPFASHPVCRCNWQRRFAPDLRRLGRFIRRTDMRISMHPDQFVLINSPRRAILGSSVRELIYHAQVLDLMQLDRTAKLQIHVGGVYSDRQASINRFVERYRMLPLSVRRRLVIENDDRSYGVTDCLAIS